MVPMGKSKENSNCHNSSYIQHRVVIFGSMVWFWGSDNFSSSFKFTPDDPRCHGNEI